MFASSYRADGPTSVSQRPILAQGNVLPPESRLDAEETSEIGDCYLSDFVTRTAGYSFSLAYDPKDNTRSHENNMLVGLVTLFFCRLRSVATGAGDQQNNGKNTSRNE